MSETTEAAPLRLLQAALRDGRLAAAVRRREHGVALDTATQALQLHGRAVEQLEQLVGVARAVSDHLDKHARLDLRRKLHELAQRGRGLTGEVTTETLENARRQLEVVDGLVRDIDTQLRRGWDRRLDAEFGSLAQLGRVLEVMSAEVELGAHMREIAAKGLGLRADFPPSREALDALADYIARRERALSSLSKSGSKIGAFLIKVSNGQATLADLDKNTLDWLCEQGALRVFSVKL